MEKLPMCRICLAENARMYIVVNRNLHELYEKLTDIPFITEDRRPMLACFFCCAKLKQCYQLLIKCLEAEELFARMKNDDYEANPLINQDHLELFCGFIKSPTENISIVDECQTESVAIKEELPAVCEGLDDIIEQMEEQHSEELEAENFDNSCVDLADIPPHYSELDLEDDVSLVEFKTEVEEDQEVYKKKRKAREMKRATVKNKPNPQRTKLKDAITPDQTKEDESDSTVIPKTHKRTSKPGTYFEEPYKYDQNSINPVKKKIQNTRTQISETSWKCDICQRSFSQKSSLLRHIRLHSGEKPYKCNVCQRSFSENYALLRHIRIHNGEKLFECGVCQCSFSEKGHLRQHSRLHTEEKPYKCDVCQRTFSEKGYLTRHIRLHNSEKPFKCELCQQSFSVKGSLERHIRIHSGEKPYKCDVCQSSFSENCSLLRHIRIHTGEKPYKCDVCQRSFSVKGNLTKHTRIHTSENLFKCNVCHLSFSEKGSLLRHIIIHTSVKPFECDICQRNFCGKGSLLRHIRIHTGEKP